MLPVPEYLKPYAIEQKQKGNQLSFSLKCSCGCERFSVLEINHTEEEKRLIREYENQATKTGWHSIYGGLDSEGKPYSYIKVLGIFKKAIEFPQRPEFMDVHVVKAACLHCRKEITLFDSRYHGYDAMVSGDAKANEYSPQFKARNAKRYHIEVRIESEASWEVSEDLLNCGLSPELCSNAFHWIHIRGTDEKGKKEVLLDSETA